MNRSNRVVVQLGDDELAKVDELRGATTRSAFFRALLRGAGVSGGGEVASHAEALEILTALARDGKMPAAIALERALRARDPELAADPFRELDELAGRR
ncbi:MAG: hypothetical protein H0V26_00390 [Solirubrobacterales bacterium]|nr:hypothetical protein [Solirubrobacterales bacterium]